MSLLVKPAIRLKYSNSSEISLSALDFDSQSANHIGQLHVFLTLEIQAEALKRLIVDRKLVAEEIHCLSQATQKLVRESLLESLTAKAT